MNDFEKKKNGVYYTSKELAKYLIKQMAIDFNKNFRLIEPAVGSAHILSEIVEIILQKKKMSVQEAKFFFENNIIGFDIRDEAIIECKVELQKRFDEFYKEKGISVDWNIQNQNIVDDLSEYNGVFDYVIANPPYVSIHNMDLETRKAVRQQKLSKTHNVDLYYTFFEKGISFLNATGKLVYITPNTYLRSISAYDLRKYIKEENLLEKVIDYADEMLFEDALTYSAITVLSKRKKKIAKFSLGKKTDNCYTESGIVNITYKQLNEKDYLSFKRTQNIDDNVLTLNDVAYLSNGLATLNDKKFIIKSSEVISVKNNIVHFMKEEKEFKLPKKYVRIAKKPSSVEYDYVFFPYEIVNDYVKEIPKEVLYKNNDVKEFLSYEKFEKKGLYFGRTQGLKYYSNSKIIISKISKNHRFTLVENGFIYSGIYIVIKPEYLHMQDRIVELLNTDVVSDFIDAMSKNYASGFKNISTTMLKEIPLLI